VNVALNHPDLRDALDCLKLTCGNGNHALAALACVKLEARRGVLALCTDDLRQRMEVEIPATVNEEGCCLLPLRRLAPAVSSLQDAVAIRSSGSGVQIVSGTTRLKLKEFDAADFPSAQVLDDPVSFLIPCAQLRKLLRVAFCISPQDPQAYRRGACLQCVGGQVACVATDGKRLASCAWPEAVGIPDFSIILSQESISTLLKILPAAGDATLLLKTHRIGLTAPGVQYQAELVDGIFPDWRSVFPSKDPSPMTFKRQVMLDALSRVSGAHDGKTRGRVELTLKSGRIQVRLDGADEELGEDEIPVDGQGDGQRVKFDLDYLVSGLKTAEDGAISFYPAFGPEKPGLFEQGGYSYVLAPMKPSN
jgi:DNA polymerase-3 subunit beta